MRTFKLGSGLSFRIKLSPDGSVPAPKGWEWATDEDGCRVLVETGAGSAVNGAYAGGLGGKVTVSGGPGGIYAYGGESYYEDTLAALAPLDVALAAVADAMLRAERAA